MSTVITCPHCNEDLRLAKSALGQRARCPICKEVFVIVGNGEESAGRREAEERRVKLQPPRDDGRRAHRAAPPQLRENRRVLRDSDEPDVRRRNPATVWVVGALIAIVIAAVAIGVSSSTKRKRSTPSRDARAESPEQRREVIRAALVDLKPITEKEIAAEVKPVLRQFGALLRDGNGEQAAELLDVYQLYDTISAQGLLPEKIIGNEREFARGLRIGAGQAFQRQAHMLNWSKTEIRHVKKLSKREAVVIARHDTKDGVALKMRWWMTRASGDWKIYDFEDLDTSMRFSSAILETVAFLRMQNRPELHRLRRAMDNLQATSVALVQGDADTARRQLGQIDEMRLPKSPRALYWWLKGIVALNDANPESALTCFDNAESHRPDMVCLDFGRGIAFNQLGQSDKALTYLNKYKNLLGEDGHLCLELGEALRNLERFDEACVAYRKALDFDPKDSESFLGLVLALDVDAEKKDLPARFAKLDLPHDNFKVCAAECVEHRKAAEIELLAQAMRKIDPQFSAVDFYLALTKAWSHDVDQATQLFRSALAKENDAEQRKDYAWEFCDTLLQHRLAVEAYQAAPNKKEAFAQLAQGLISLRYDVEALREIVSLHARTEPKNRWLPLCRGVIQTIDGDYNLAERSFAIGMANPPADFVDDEVRWHRVETLYHQKKAMKAYEEIRPRHDTFTQLASLLFWDKKDAELTQLLDAHAKFDPKNVDVQSYRIRLMVRMKEFVKATALFKKVAARNDLNDNKSITWQFCSAMASAGKSVDAYRAASDRKEAFAILADQLEEDADWAELKRLLQARRAEAPNDPLIAYHEAEQFFRGEAWDKGLKVLAAAWENALKDGRNTLRWQYVRAHYKTGQALQAYATIEPRGETFSQLANLMIADNKNEQLAKLVEAHRPHADDDPELHYFESRLKILTGETAHAVAHLKKALKNQMKPYQRNWYVRSFVLTMHERGKGVEGYRAAPDSSTAFDALAQRLVVEQKHKKLEELINAHRQADAASPNLPFYLGELHLLRDEPKKAEPYFARASKETKAHWNARDRLDQVRVQLGRTVETYQAQKSTRRAFVTLAQKCVTLKNHEQLAALIAAHRQEHADDAMILRWQMEVEWLKGNYAAVVTLIQTKENRVFARRNVRYVRNDRLIRALVKLRKHDEAIRAAEDASNSQWINVLLVLAHAAAGDVNRVMKLAEEHLKEEDASIDWWYQDEDLGPLLRSEPFRQFRQKYPEPKQNNIG